MLLLTQTDIQRLAAESWIDADLAQKARLYRVDGETGARMLGREKTHSQISTRASCSRISLLGSTQEPGSEDIG